MHLLNDQKKNERKALLLLLFVVYCCYILCLIMSKSLIDPIPRRSLFSVETASLRKTGPLIFWRLFLFFYIFRSVGQGGL